MGFKHLVHLISFTWVALRVCRSASDWYLISHSRGPWGQVTLLNRHLPQKCERVPSSSFLYHLDLEAAPLGSVCAGVQGDYREWSKFYLDLLQQLGDQLLVTFPPFLPPSHSSLLPSLCQQKRCRPWPWGSPTSTLAVAEQRLTVWRCNPTMLSKNISRSNGAAQFRPDLSTRHCPRTHQLLHPFLPYLCVVQAAFIFLPFFFF